MLDNLEFSVIIQKFPAGVAHPVERHLAKVEVASSSLVTRSKKRFAFAGLFSFFKSLKKLLTFSENVL